MFLWYLQAVGLAEGVCEKGRACKKKNIGRSKAAGLPKTFLRYLQAVGEQLGQEAWTCSELQEVSAKTQKHQPPAGRPYTAEMLLHSICSHAAELLDCVTNWGAQTACT